MVSHKAPILFEVVSTLLNRINVNNKAVAFHLKRALILGFGHLTRQTYQPFRITIFPYL